MRPTTTTASCDRWPAVQVLTPDEEEDNGFEGGVLSSRESRESRAA